MSEADVVVVVVVLGVGVAVDVFKVAVADGKVADENDALDRPLLLAESSSC